MYSFPLPSSIFSLLQPLFWSNPHEAIKNAYDSTNKYILENAKQLGPGGSTAVTAIVVDGKDMWIANVGDSRAVLCERGAANQITVDHEPHTTNERQRIEQQGGFVTTFPGMILILQLSHNCSFSLSATSLIVLSQTRYNCMCAFA
jgi:protein phosphatase 1L